VIPFFFPFIAFLPEMGRSNELHQTTQLKYVQDHILLEGELPVGT